MNLQKLPDITKEIIDKYFPNGFSIRDEANGITAYAFRNGPIEDLHAGEDSELLRSNSLSRITNDEMKLIMIEASRKINFLLEMKEVDLDAYKKCIMVYNVLFCSGWER